MTKNSKNIVVGEIGEDIACRFLLGKGFKIIERNYRKKWGEIDIIAKKGSVLEFVEVKTVSCESIDYVTQETSKGVFRPEDNVHREKIRRFKNTIETYLSEKRIGDMWQCSIITVRLAIKDKKAKVEMLENIIL